MNGHNSQAICPYTKYRKYDGILISHISMQFRSVRELTQEMIILVAVIAAAMWVWVRDQFPVCNTGAEARRERPINGSLEPFPVH